MGRRIFCFFISIWFFPQWQNISYAEDCPQETVRRVFENAGIEEEIRLQGGYRAVHLMHWVDPKSGQIEKSRRSPWVFFKSEGIVETNEVTLRELDIITKANELMKTTSGTTQLQAIDSFLESTKKIKGIQWFMKQEGRIFGLVVMHAALTGVHPTVYKQLAGDILPHITEEYLASFITQEFAKDMVKLLLNPKNLTRAIAYPLLFYSKQNVAKMF